MSTEVGIKSDMQLITAFATEFYCDLKQFDSFQFCQR